MTYRGHIQTAPAGARLRKARRWVIAAAAAVALATAQLGGINAPAAGAAVPKALINADTVSGSPSVEETDAAALGFAVTVVDGPTWSAMTAADFGQYDVLIAGDLPCGAIPPSFSSNETTWAPVVMGAAGGRTQAGNRVVVGTDPVLHGGGALPRDRLVRDGIAFAGAQPGRTGLYFDTSCGGDYYGQLGLAASMLQQLSTGAGTWTEDDDPPCGGNVAKISSTPQFDSLTSADLQGWGCSVHESFPTFADDWHPLAVATDTATHPVCGTDADTGLTACGEPYVLIAGSGIVVTSPDIELTPLTSTNPVGTDHTVTATVTSGPSKTAVVGQLVNFTVTGQNAGATGVCVPADCKTDSNGQVSFTYHDTNGAGVDTITASFTDAGGTKQQATASKTWSSGPSAIATTTTYTGASTVQYSDAAALSGTLLDSSSVGVAGKTLGFTLGTQSTTAGPTDASGNASTSLTVNQQPTVTTVATSFAGDASYLASSDSAPFTITKEDCTVAYTGDTLVAPLANTTLAAQMGEPDSSLGDLSGKTVTFTLTDSSAAVTTYNAVTNATGAASTSVPLPADIYGAVVSFAGDDFYKPCSSPSAPNDTLITVQAAGAKVTGGGWFSSTYRTSFGLNLIPQAGGLYKGQIQLRTNNGKGKFHGNTATGVVVLASNKVSWKGTGKWQGVPGYTYEVTVVDNGSSGAKKGDTISVKVYQTSTPANVVYNSNGAVVLKGGNLTVH